MPQLTKGRITVSPALSASPTQLDLATTRLVQIQGSHTWYYGYDPDGPFRRVAQQELFELDGYVVSLKLWVYSTANAVLTIEVLS